MTFVAISILKTTGSVKVSKGVGVAPGVLAPESHPGEMSSERAASLSVSTAEGAQ